MFLALLRTACAHPASVMAEVWGNGITELLLNLHYAGYLGGIRNPHRLIAIVIAARFAASSRRRCIVMHWCEDNTFCDIYQHVVLFVTVFEAR